MDERLIQTAREAIEEQIRDFMKSRPVCLLFQEHKVTVAANGKGFPALMETRPYFEEKYRQYAIRWEQDDSLADGEFSFKVEE
ncbi:MAG: hypothetical protein IKT15_03285 [Firmicutes bacterium]|jgi:hypothetical protein|nr:hypothetical protein [Bacillota bacterium]MBR6503977.1 hypothetical protein [Bacillota bacterium]